MGAPRLPALTCQDLGRESGWPGGALSGEKNPNRMKNNAFQLQHLEV